MGSVQFRVCADKLKDAEDKKMVKAEAKADAACQWCNLGGKEYSQLTIAYRSSLQSALRTHIYKIIQMGAVIWVVLGLVSTACITEY